MGLFSAILLLGYGYLLQQTWNLRVGTSILCIPPGEVESSGHDADAIRQEQILSSMIYISLLIHLPDPIFAASASVASEIRLPSSSLTFENMAYVLSRTAC